MLRGLIALFVCLWTIAPGQAEASVNVRVSKSSQQMYVYVNGSLQHVWATSTARRNFYTPVGTFRPQRLERSWYSRKYNNAPMPYSVFFHKGYAIHGTNEVKYLGRPASRGCVRLAPKNAAVLFSLIRQYGPASTRITITH
jgi:lipoprotein-anchoring transpeptidase ErfK/SrfK